MPMRRMYTLLATTFGVTMVLACSPDAGNAPESPAPGARSVPQENAAPDALLALSAVRFGIEAAGVYQFHIPADFNDGIFGVAIDNSVAFVAIRKPDGRVTGWFRYVQTAEGQDFIFSGRVTCLVVYDTPVLERFEFIPPLTQNRAKWGGVIEKSNDPTQPAGRFLWFQSIDNKSGRSQQHPHLSTLAGFGDEAANEAFCNSPNVPNPRFGPHAVNHGFIVVK